MKLVLFLITLLVTTEAWARPSQRRDLSSFESVSKHAAYAATGFSEGGFSIGLDYEYSMRPTYGVGGYTRFYGKDDARPANGLFTAGAFIRPHFKRQAWNFYVSPGFGIVSIQARGDSTTSLGPSIAFGLLYQVQRQIAIGVENMKTHVWFSQRYRGQVMDDLMLKARVSF